MIEDKTMKLGDIHTYLELYGRLFIDLIPNVVLVAADKADRQGNLYTGYNTEETPTIVEAAAFKDGIVIVKLMKWSIVCRGSIFPAIGSMLSW